MSEEAEFIASLVAVKGAESMSSIAKKVIEVIAAKITTEIDLKMIAFECAWRLADLEGPKERSAPWKPEAESQKAKARAKAKAVPKPDLFAPKESTDDQAD